ncbi:MAG: hypothetical protein NW206_19615 [Hyphomonadaceae bacterium]|nr:hypothetical protein [Hyphomonadaceae bacterium]
MSKRRGRATSTPRFVVTPAGRMVPRDPVEHEQWLAIHGKTPSGKAWIVSRDGHRDRTVTVPCVLLDVGEAFAGFGFNRAQYDAEKRRWEQELVPICWVSGPGFVFDEKGLRDA